MHHKGTKDTKPSDRKGFFVSFVSFVVTRG